VLLGRKRQKCQPRGPRLVLTFMGHKCREVNAKTMIGHSRQHGKEVTIFAIVGIHYARSILLGTDDEEEEGRMYSLAFQPNNIHGKDTFT